MFAVRAEQLQAFEDDAMQRFEDEMLAHARQFSPVLAEALGGPQLRAAVRHVLKQGKQRGFTNRGPLRLCVEAMLLFGSAFDTDPQYPWMAEALDGAGDQMERAEALWKQIVDFQSAVGGPAGVHTGRALRDLLSLARRGVEISSDGFADEIYREMSRVFPEKASYVGDDGLRKIIRRGSAGARQYGLPEGSGDALMVALMYSLGHGCVGDPLRPWIRRTLLDVKLSSPQARQQRLREEAVAWLEQVLIKLPPPGANS